jgi:DNA-binding FadR family transcriptional regulator
MRELIEGRAARVAATTRTDDDLDRMVALAAEPMAELSFDDAYDAHCAFHLAIATASKNRLLVLVIRPIFNVLKPFAAQVRVPPEATHDAHDGLISAIRNRRPARAEELMLAHLAHVRSAYSDQEAGARTTG